MSSLRATVTCISECQILCACLQTAISCHSGCEESPHKAKPHQPQPRSNPTTRLIRSVFSPVTCGGRWRLLNWGYYVSKLGYRLKSRRTGWQCPSRQGILMPTEKTPARKGPPTSYCTFGTISRYLDRGVRQTGSAHHPSTQRGGAWYVSQARWQACLRCSTYRPRHLSRKYCRHRYIHPARGFPGWAGGGARGEPRSCYRPGGSHKASWYRAPCLPRRKRRLQHTGTQVHDI